MFQNFFKNCSSDNSVVTNSDVTEFPFIDVIGPMRNYPNRVLKAVEWDGLPVSRAPVRITGVISASSRISTGPWIWNVGSANSWLSTWGHAIPVSVEQGTTSVIFGTIRTSNEIDGFCFTIGDVVSDIMLTDMPKNTLTCVEQRQRGNDSQTAYCFVIKLTCAPMSISACNVWLSLSTGMMVMMVRWQTTLKVILN